MKSMIVIGDVHGCYKTLMALIEKLPKGINYCLVGDLVDRGPQNRAVIDFVRSNNIPCVVGNHELLMESNDPEMSQCWYMNGGRETRREYENDSDFEADREWIRSLPLYLEFHDIKDANDQHLVVSHTTLEEFWYYRDKMHTRFDAVWTRNHYPSRIDGVFNIYGHTPVKKPVIKDYFANIDTGCVYGNSMNLGTLTALQFPEMIIYQQKCIDLLEMDEVYA
jgi:serine/threonine protein phosphatase 1